MRTNFQQAPEKIIVDLINADNGTNISVGELTFGVPEPFFGTRNTKVIATATPNSPYSGSVPLTYNRVNLATIPGIRNTIFPVGTSVKISDLIPEINQAYQLNLTPADFLDATLPAFDAGQYNEEMMFNLTANPSSLIFIGNLVLTLRRNEVPLSSVITVTALNGLVYVQPVVVM